MPTVTAPYVETQQVVTGFMYQLHISEETDGPGITRLDIGPYYFSGRAPQVKYPEAVTNEMCPPEWQSVRWFTDESGASWLRWQGGRLLSEDGETVFQLTSNYPPREGGAALHVWRSGRRSAERYSIPAPDYSQSPPKINPRHDVIGNGSTFAARKGCAPVLIAGSLCTLAEVLRHYI